MPGCEFIFARLFGNGSPQDLYILKQNIHGLHHLDGKCRVHDVTAGQAENGTQRLAWWLIFSATAVVKPMTSWLRTLSSSFCRAT